jgi:branched-chain amino acid transport system permease protein
MMTRLSDGIVFVIAAVLLGAVLLLPWLVIEDRGELAGIEQTAVALLTDTPEEGFAEPLLTEVTAGDENRRALGSATSTMWGVINHGVYVPLIAVVAVVLAATPLVLPRYRDFISMLLSGLGVFALLYFVPIFTNDRFTDYGFDLFTGVGFWVALVAVVGLVVQLAIPRQTPESPGWVQKTRRFLWENRVYLVLFALLMILPHAIGWFTDSSPFAFQRGRVFRMTGASGQWMRTLIETFVIVILVMSYNLMFGFTGVISFGHALFFGIGGYGVAMILQLTGVGSNIGLLGSVVIVLVVTGVLGFLIGLASLRLSGVYFAIFTLAVAEIAFIYAGRWAVTGGEEGLNIEALPQWIDPDASRLNLYYIGLFMFVLFFLFIQRLVNSPTGAVFKAIRENEERAKSIGYNTLYYKLFSISVAGMMAGMAGFLHAILNEKIGPEFFGVNYTVEALLMTIIGGAGTLAGPVIGGAGLHLADTQLRDAQFELLGTTVDIGGNWLLILGLIFIVVVMVFPYGIVGTYYNLKAKLASWRRSEAQPPDADAGQPVQKADTTSSV